MASREMRNQDRMVLLSAAIRASVEAGKSILEVYDTEFDVQMKEDCTPLTLADQRSHEILFHHLQETGIPILSEEGKDIPYQERREWDLLWIVDPLDGTKEFIKRNGEFTVNVALVGEGRVVMAVVLAPAAGALFYASSGSGSFKCEGKGSWYQASPEEIMTRAILLPRSRPHTVPAMKDKPQDAPSRPLVVVGSRSHATPELMAFVEEKRRDHKEVDFISAGSSLKFCLVAEGSADFYPRLGPTCEWDTAAAQAVVEAAGGAVTTLDGRPLRYNERDTLLNPHFLAFGDPGRDWHRYF